ncbi:diguanylate cyclase [uncultured Microbacterium sp.]|uniref:diguanylate cyclase n=1 Tax=uncultured Microbacterium sp. TaxID=191216 RepID=UPI0025F6B820|nr:diguanylate cyclase [uncultured Microbacterium sp.]
MNLDLFSVTVMTAIVASVASLTFIIDTLLRRDTGPGRLWAVAFFCGLATTLAYMAWSAGVGGAVSVAVGNALFVSVPGFMLLGCRRFNDRSVLVSSVAVGTLAVITFVAALIEYPTRGSWGGWWAMAASLVVFFGAGAAESLRSPMRGLRSAWALSTVLAAAGVFYAVRLVVFVTLGPQSELFSRWLGSISANIVTVILTMVAAIVMSVLRSQRTTRQRYEWLTSNGVAADGVMLPRTFAGALADIVERASWRQEGIAVIVLRADGLDEIGDAFGGDVVDTISAACRHAARSFAPAAALVGEDGDGQLVICTLAESTADARRVGSALFRGAIDELTAVAHGRLASVGVGVGLTSSLGYDPGILMIAARSAALRAARIAEASVFVAPPSTAPADADVASS